MARGERAGRGRGGAVLRALAAVAAAALTLAGAWPGAGAAAEPVAGPGAGVGLGAGAGPGAGAGARGQCSACEVANEMLSAGILQVMARESRRLPAGTKQTVNLNLTELLAADVLGNPLWEDPIVSYAPGLRADVGRLLGEHSDAFVRRWSNRQPDAPMVFQVYKELCIQDLGACPALPPVPAERRRTACEACEGVVDDVTRVLGRSAFASGAARRRRVSDVLDSICSEIPMRHDPAPRWKGNTLDVEAACEDLVAYHDTAIVDAWMALGTHENPRNAICRDVARACGGTEEL